jgi:hypothetical protein
MTLGAAAAAGVRLIVVKACGPTGRDRRLLR